MRIRQTPEEVAIWLCNNVPTMRPQYGPEDEAMIAKAIQDLLDLRLAQEREHCAKLCDTIADDKFDQYKGRGAHAPNNDHRADIYTEGESSGAELCATAIREQA